MEWATALEMDFITMIGEATHRDDNVSDLVWSNTAAVASVSISYHCASDHSAISGCYTGSVKLLGERG